MGQGSDWDLGLQLFSIPLPLPTASSHLLEDILWCLDDAERSKEAITMKLFGKRVFPRQMVLAMAGLLFLASTTYNVHRCIKSNENPPTKEQIQALEDYHRSRRPSP